MSLTSSPKSKKKQILLHPFETSFNHSSQRVKLLSFAKIWLNEV